MNKFADFQAEIINELKHPDVICLTETWLDDKIPNDIFDCSGAYNLFRFDRNRDGGGVAIFVRSELTCDSVEISDTGGLEFISVQVKCNLTDVIFVCVYKPSVTDSHLIQPLSVVLDHLSRKGLPCVLVGDFNLPGIQWDALTAPLSNGQHDFLSLFLSHGLYQKVEEPTRFSALLDLVFGNEPNLVMNVSVLPPMSNCDHNVVYFEVNVGKPDTNSPTTNGWAWDRANLGAIQLDLELMNWPIMFLGLDSIDAKWNLFVDTCHDLFNKHVPTYVKKSAKQKSTIRYPNRIKNLVCKKKKFYELMKANPFNFTFKDNFKKVSMSLKQEIFLFHRDRESKMLHRPSSKKFFQHIKSRLVSKPHILRIVADNDRICDSDFDKAEALNDYFSSVFIDDDGIVAPDEPACDVSIDDFLITRENIVSSINSLKSGSASGPDKIPAKFLKLFPCLLAVPLQIIFQSSFDSGILPAQWKTASVIPIFKKKGKNSDPSMYRPVSLTCIACKVFEKIIKNQIFAHCSANRIISDHQHGFVQKKSTQTQLLECANYWTYQVDQKNGVDVVYLDISKAFDTVSHPKLLKKLGQFGIKGKFLKWIANFLSDRTQKVTVNGVFSSSASVKSGVPQGSVLGPLLFILYINDIVKTVLNVQIKIFADDCKLYIAFKKLDGYEMLLRDLIRVFSWFDLNQLRVAMEKCLVLHFGYYNRRLEYVINNVQIPSVSLARDLGVLVSDDMKFSEHCAKLSSTASQRAGLIYKTFLCRDREFLIAMFVVYVRPILEFNSCVWSPHQVMDVNIIESVQKRYFKRMPGLENKTYEQCLSSLGFKTLEHRRVLFDLIQCYKIVRQLDGLAFHEFFQYDPQNYDFGYHPLALTPPRTNLACRKYFFSSRVVPVWNSLPADVAQSESLEIFIKRIGTLTLSRFLKYKF